MTIRFKLLSCISLLVGVILAISFFSFYAMGKEAELANSIVTESVLPMEQLKAISDSYAVSIVGTAHKVRSGAMTPEEGVETVKTALAVIEHHWAAYAAMELTAEEQAVTAHFLAMRNAADEGVKQLLSVLENSDRPGLEVFVATKLYATIDPLGEDIAKLIDLQIKGGKHALEEGNAFKSLLLTVMICQLAIAAAIAAASAWTVLKRVLSPIRLITGAMRQLAEGDIEVAIYGEGRKDEIGGMASAVAVFRDNARDRLRLEQEVDASRSHSEQERLERGRQRAREAEEVEFAVKSIGEALGQLSEGRLNHRIDTVFAEHLDGVRLDFNGAVEKLEEAMRRVGQNAQAIAAGSQEIRTSADELSGRTEKQAASVEETAAALGQITHTVSDSSRRAEEAGKLVDSTRDAAEKSGEIVSRAVEAMHDIEASSNEISSIIGVIDEIAFQTNLLALNAGVEAARAGNAGKGFAVVAQEVRELAQRSATAAKEIKALIAKSGDQVKNGVSLVTETGKALTQIVSQVQTVSGNVAAIVDAAKEQATGLKEISTAVNSMDQATQQNAAMVEESTAASHSLAREAEALFELIAGFEIGSRRDSATNAYRQAGNDRPAPRQQAPSPARRAAYGTIPARNGNAALKPMAWEDF